MVAEYMSSTAYFYTAYVNVTKDLVETGGNGNKSYTSS